MRDKFFTSHVGTPGGGGLAGTRVLICLNQGGGGFWFFIIEKVRGGDSTKIFFIAFAAN